MKGDLLKDWVNSDIGKGVSQREIARRLDLSHAIIGRWLKSAIKFLKDETLQAIATYKQQPLEEVCTWLEVPVPESSFQAARWPRQ